MSNATNTVSLNGQDYVVMPLNWKQLKQCKEAISIVSDIKPNQGMISEEQQDAILKVVTASLQRNRPDLTEEFVADHLDLGNMGVLLQQVFGKQAASGNGQVVPSTK